MKKDIKLCLLLAPLIFMVLLCVPAMMEGIGYRLFVREGPKVLWILHLVMLIIAMVIWGTTFYHIPIDIYIAILAVYTVVSWVWILNQKKGNALYFIMWIILCALSVQMYWEWGSIYGSLMYL